MASLLVTYSPEDSSKYELMEQVFAEQYTADDHYSGQIIAREQRTGRRVDTCYADGAYNRRLEKDQQAGQEHVEMGFRALPRGLNLPKPGRG